MLGDLDWVRDLKEVVVEQQKVVDISQLAEMDAERVFQGENLASIYLSGIKVWSCDAVFLKSYATCMEGLPRRGTGHPL